tara:strand:- start:334 stop:849 length:516 start_codon:yes stop_codon:yes gene_type:complete
MSDDLLRPALDKFAEGDLEGAVEMLDALRGQHRNEAALHHTYAEFANMLNMDAQEDVIPGGKIMMAYKKAMQLDEENDEYIADFADFALECNRIPQAVKEFQRYATRLEMADIPFDDRLYNAARNLVDRIEVVDPERTSDISQPWLKQALLWSIGGLGFSAEDVKGILEDA